MVQDFVSIPLSELMEKLNPSFLNILSRVDKFGDVFPDSIRAIED